MKVPQFECDNSEASAKASSSTASVLSLSISGSNRKHTVVYTSMSMQEVSSINPLANSGFLHKRHDAVSGPNKKLKCISPDFKLDPYTFKVLLCVDNQEYCAR